MDSDDQWLTAAETVLMQARVPMRYTDIKRVILEMGLVSLGLKTTLEAALFKEVQKSDRKFTLVEGQTGVFALVDRPDATVQKPKTSPVVHKPPVEREQKHVMPRPERTVLKVPSPVRAKLPSPAHPVASTSQVQVVKPSTSHTSHPHDNSKYYMKYKFLKRHIKNMIFTNAAICDEVIKLEEKIVQVKEERRYLLRRLLKNQAMSDVLAKVIGQASPGGTLTGQAALSRPTTQSVAQLLGVVEKKKKKTTSPSGAAKKKAPKEPAAQPDTPTSSSTAPKPVKKPKSLNTKRQVQPIPLDKTGRPIFPIELGPLTVYSVGEIMSEFSSYNTTEYIFPVGYCSTRPYISIRNPSTKCLYTCKISDMPTGPKFEISPEDMPEKVFTSMHISRSHMQLLRAVNEVCGTDVVPLDSDKGAEFFGLSHPAIQNLIQSMPGAKKSPGYRWIKFEVCKDIEYKATDPAVCAETLMSSSVYVQAMSQRMDLDLGTDHGGSLRTLLTTAASQ